MISWVPGFGIFPSQVFAFKNQYFLTPPPFYIRFLDWSQAFDSIGHDRLQYPLLSANMESLLFLPVPVSSTSQNSQLILHNITSNAESDKDVHLEYGDDTVPISHTQSKHSAASYTSFNICSLLTGSFCISSGTFSPHLCAFPLAFSLPPLPPSSGC